MATTKAAVTRGSVNVFRDLGLKKPEELLAKAKLAARIVQILQARELPQTQAAKVLGIDQPKVSQLYRPARRFLSRTADAVSHGARSRHSDRRREQATAGSRPDDRRGGVS